MDRPTRARFRRGQCVNCGRSNWIDAVDNLGRPYKGCAHCRLLSLEEISAQCTPPEPKR